MNIYDYIIASMIFWMVGIVSGLIIGLTMSKVKYYQGKNEVYCKIINDKKENKKEEEAWQRLLFSFREKNIVYYETINYLIKIKGEIIMNNGIIGIVKKSEKLMDDVTTLENLIKDNVKLENLLCNGGEDELKLYRSMFNLMDSTKELINEEARAIHLIYEKQEIIYKRSQTIIGKLDILLKEKEVKES